MSPKDPDPRPDPEALLKLAQAEAASVSRGKLKIFLGYSAGVGKTYAMLEAAQRLKRDGVDVVVGYVEAHKRPETTALLDGLEILPRKILPYKNTSLEELDLDAVIERRPAVAIVDELAHTNAPGSRHVKRHQDVEELLAAGIDVYTTLNVQHLESLNDVVAKVTGVAMQETLPDRVFDEAREIEVIDIPIGELLKRFREGRVYVPEAAEHAIQNYFTENNLTALRELALRRAAKRIDTQMQSLLRVRITGGPLPVGERLLVCVSPYPSSTELVRSARLLAAGLDAEWFAVYVETPGRISAAEKEQIARTLKLAEELGGKVVTLSGRRVADEAVSYARRHNVTKILIGKPLKRRLKDVLLGTVADQLIRQSGEIDVHVINRTARGVPRKEPPAPAAFPWMDYLNGFFLVVAATLLGMLTRPFFEPTNLVMYYLAAVVAASVFLSRGSAIFTAVLGVAAFDFLLIPPYFTFAVSDTQYLFTFFTLFVTGLVISALTARVKEQAERASAREIHTASLYSLSRDLAGVHRREMVFDSVIRHVRESLGMQAMVFAPGPDGSLTAVKKTDDLPPDDREKAVADWVFRNAQPAGWGTDTLPAAAGHYLPIGTSRAVYGVLGVLRGAEQRGPVLRLADRHLLESFTGQAAAAVERVRFSEEAQKARLLEEKEKLQSALLNSISHDFRTPLVSITGSLSGMLKNPGMDVGSRQELVENAYEEAGRLNRLVGNLLDMARLEAGAVKVLPSLCEVRDVIGSSLKELEERLADRKVTVTIQEELPHVPMDFGLMMKVLVNLIDNAVKYAPFGLPIDIEAREADGWIEIRVLDRGLGIPQGDLEHVFDKFYRVKRPQNFEGTGLGLSICKGIVEAHRGRIRAENRPGGGTIVTVALPIKR